MSNQTQSAEIKDDVQNGQEPSHGHAHLAPKITVPPWIIAAYLLVLACGAILIFGRKTFSENALFDALQDCEAKVPPIWYEKNIPQRTNGTSDLYAVVHVSQHRESIANLLALCESDPEAGRRIFRRALDTGNKNSKLVGLFLANYLARAQTTPNPQLIKGVLEEQDIARMIKLLDATNESDLDIRKYAVHALSDLVILTDASAIAAVTADANAENRYTKITDTMRDAANKALSVDVKDEAGDVQEKNTQDKRRDLKVATRKDTLNGKDVLLVRWSTPGLALAWWTEHAKDGAKWDMDLQRYVFP